MQSSGTYNLRAQCNLGHMQFGHNAISGICNPRAHAILEHNAVSGIIQFWQMQYRAHAILGDNAIRARAIFGHVQSLSTMQSR
ncbi:hypothetical protein KY290_010663 [Solanum tuberosum]|uniref:Uncharacterized protein n=1 Tax=Solanum tuberosum TaxID=4113 RepID=A0ABQ7VYE7_SOLTU|nr:hypothetical protein KY290_010663 [Solanum tuberosum]